MGGPVFKYSLDEVYMTLRGVFNIMATAFDSRGAVDPDSQRRLVDMILDTGVHGLAILGVMGEAHKLSDSERLAVTRTVIEHVAGRVPVVVGTGAASNEVAVLLSREAADAGAAGLMILPPRLGKPNPDAIVAYYADIAQAVDAPLVIHDYPPASGVYLAPSLLARIAQEVPSARYVKLEDPPIGPKVTQVRAAAPDLVIFGGQGGMFFLEELERGALGTMTGFAYPEVLVEIYTRFTEGDHAGAAAVFDRWMPLIRYEGQPEVGLAIRKEILRRRGALSSAYARPPVMPLDEPAHGEIDHLLRRVGVA